MGVQLHYVLTRRGRLTVKAADCESLRTGLVRSAEKEYSNRADFLDWLSSAFLPATLSATIESDLEPVIARIGHTFASEELPLTDRQLVSMRLKLMRRPTGTSAAESSSPAGHVSASQ
jgi:hypothetical protein